MWFFFGTNVAYGEDALNFLDNIPFSKVFIVSDKVLVDLGVVKILTDRLDQNGKQYERTTGRHGKEDSPALLRWRKPRYCPACNA